LADVTGCEDDELLGHSGHRDIAVDRSFDARARSMVDHENLTKVRAAYDTVAEAYSTVIPDTRFESLLDMAMIILAWYSIIHSARAALPAIAREFWRVLRPAGSVLIAFQAGSGDRKPQP
jgi:hypothetical protein